MKHDPAFAVTALAHRQHEPKGVSPRFPHSPKATAEAKIVCTTNTLAKETAAGGVCTTNPVTEENAAGN